MLKTFLMSRSPIKGFEASNGHGRRQPGLEVVSRQSNLIVESTNAVSGRAAARRCCSTRSRSRASRTACTSATSRAGSPPRSAPGLQAFKVIPVIVYRVYADGRPDELVRGADIVGTPLASFSKILATGDKPEVFNGYCGAESGSVPVSAVSPAILVSEIEIEKKAKSNDRPPLLPEPTTHGERQGRREMKRLVIAAVVALAALRRCRGCQSAQAPRGRPDVPGDARRDGPRAQDVARQSGSRRTSCST